MTIPAAWPCAACTQIRMGYRTGLLRDKRFSSATQASARAWILSTGEVDRALVDGSEATLRQRRPAWGCCAFHARPGPPVLQRRTGMVIGEGTASCTGVKGTPSAGASPL